MTLRAALLGAVLTPFLATLAMADPILGTWATEPDGRGQIGHVEVRACGPAFCGRLVRAYSSDGAAVTTPNVGKEMFWDLAPAGSGSYGGGRIFVPIMSADFPVEMTLTGGTLRLQACNGVGICRSQTWQRVN